LIIGLNGFRESGKDTAGAYLVKHYGFHRLSFAEPLKQSVANLFDISLEEIEEWKNWPSVRVNLSGPSGRMTRDIKKYSDMDFRTFLQRYGTEAHRDVFGENFWVDQAMSQIEEGKNYVFTDARFPNELMAIRKAKGLTVRIERDVTTNDAHRSEAVPPRWLIDRYLHNSRDFEFLYEQLDLLMHQCQISFRN
jgi:hypothetical protein